MKKNLRIEQVCLMIGSKDLYITDSDEIALLCTTFIIRMCLSVWWPS